MAFLIKVVTCVAIASLAQAMPPTDTYAQLPLFAPKDDQAPDSSDTPFVVPTNFQLPRAEAAQVPFYVPDLTTALKAPQYSDEPSFYEVPLPAQDLTAPTQTQWNPENDPKLFYYEVPAVLSQQDVPTNAYPKKFNKEIHSKSKPFAGRPKQEITLQPIDEKAYGQRQKSLGKVFDRLAKKENQKKIAQVALPPITSKPAATKAEKQRLEPQVAESGFTNAFNSEGNSFASNHQPGLSAALTASLGITSPHSSSSSGERLDFHMVGHDGPHSYKWGFDTGKGHNRQFRYEERDKQGIVKGHFGFYDKHGKLQMMHYDAYPHEGFHAEGNFGKHHPH